STKHWGLDKFGHPYDPQKSFINSKNSPYPAHFEPRFGGDMGADANTGFFWYEKIDGFVPDMPDLVSELHPAVSADLSGVTWNLTIKNLGKAAANGPFSVSMEVGNSANPQFPSGRVFIVAGVGSGKSIEIPNPIQTSFFSCPSHKYQVVINV